MALDAPLLRKIKFKPWNWRAPFSIDVYIKKLGASILFYIWRLFPAIKGIYILSTHDNCWCKQRVFFVCLYSQGNIQHPQNSTKISLFLGLFESQSIPFLNSFFYFLIIKLHWWKNKSNQCTQEVYTDCTGLSTKRAII